MLNGDAPDLPLTQRLGLLASVMNPSGQAQVWLVFESVSLLTGVGRQRYWQLWLAQWFVTAQERKRFSYFSPKIISTPENGKLPREMDGGSVWHSKHAMKSKTEYRATEKINPQNVEKNGDVLFFFDLQVNSWPITDLTFPHTPRSTKENAFCVEV